MTISFSWEWQSAPDVRTPELSATWSRLTVGVDDIITTLIEERESPQGVRKGLDVPTYPLAEWLAINWWVLNAPAHRPRQGNVRLTDAGSGFPWPDLTLRSDRDYMWAEVRQRDRDPDFVRFLTQGRAVLDAQQCVGQVARFIDATVRRLEDRAISGTMLQQEWTAIAHADDGERDFCTVAAAWGFDPYDLSQETTEAILRAGGEVGDARLLAELARAIDFDSIPSAGKWLAAATERATVGGVTMPSVGSFVSARSGGARPWRVGYSRARLMRELLGLSPTEPAPIEAFVAVSGAAGDPPSNVVGLVKVTDVSAGIVLGRQLDEPARRFAGARALARKAMASSLGLSLLTRGSQYSDRVERAFAAEFLAPAAGLRQLMNGDYSEESQRIVAKAFGVSPWLVEHQVDNQLAA